MPCPVWDTPATFSLLLLVLGLHDWLFVQGPQNPHEYDHDDELHHCLGQYCGLHGSVCGMHYSLTRVLHAVSYTEVYTRESLYRAQR